GGVAGRHAGYDGFFGGQNSARSLPVRRSCGAFPQAPQPARMAGNKSLKLKLDLVSAGTWISSGAVPVPLLKRNRRVANIVAIAAQQRGMRKIGRCNAGNPAIRDRPRRADG